MKHNYFRYYKPKVIISFIIISGSTLGAIITLMIRVFSDLDISYYQYPTASVAVAMLILLIDKKWWNKKPFKYLFRIPDLSGRYEGKIHFVHPVSKVNEQKQCYLEIIQTGSKIKLNCYFQKENGEEKTPSRSIVETIVENEDDTYSIVFTYKNLGITGKFPEHYGTNILKVIKNDEGLFLRGDYFTNRFPHQTRGEMYLKFINKQIKNDY